MLPIRRIAGDFREVRWGHVLVEFVMLVVGILLALAVNNWVEERRDARIERQYLERLVRDFDADLEMIAEFAGFETLQREDGVMAWRALSDPASITDRDAVATALSHLSARRTLRLNRAAYTDLTSTGNLRLIRNGALRDQIVGLYEANDRFNAIIDRNNLVYIDESFAAYLASSALVAPRPSSNIPLLDRTQKQMASRMGQVPGTEFDRLWRLGPESVEWASLRNLVWTRTFISQANVNYFDAAVARTIAARAAVIAELDRRWPGSGTALGDAPAAQPAVPTSSPAPPPPAEAGR